MSEGPDREMSEEEARKARMERMERTTEAVKRDCNAYTRALADVEAGPQYVPLTTSRHRGGGVNEGNVRDVVTYHAPSNMQAEFHQDLALATEVYIRAILRLCPSCADRTAAIRAAREAKFWASASIALDGMV